MCYSAPIYQFKVHILQPSFLGKTDAPHIIVTHILHRHALATKTLPSKMAECVNYVRKITLRHCIISELCKEMGSEFEVHLLHSNIHVFAMHVEIALFLQEHQHCHADGFKNPEFILILTYMSDIFAALNPINQQIESISWKRKNT